MSGNDIPRRPGAAPVLRIQLFGPLRIERSDGGRVEPRTRKARAILGYLALGGGRFASRAKLAGLLWDRVPEAQARKSLRQALSELGSALSADYDGILDARRDSLRLSPERFTTDLGDLLKDGSINPADYLPPLLENLDGLSASFDDWLYQERSHKTELVRAWHENRIARLMQEGAQPGQRIEAARALLNFDPAHERAWRTLIAGLAEIGDVGQAIREYGACKESLKRLLDAEPSEETQALAEQLRRAENRGEEKTRPLPPAQVAATPPADAAKPPLERQASIAVLPFARLSSGPSVQLVADGLLEGVIHVLSGIGDLFVIARGTAMRYADASTRTRDIHAELGVRYLLSGTVSSFDRQMAIFVELSESDTGRVVWSERFRTEARSLFELQDDMSARIVAQIAPSVRANDLARAQRKSPGNLTAYELLLQGLDKLYHLDQPRFEEAGAKFRRAMDMDPGYSAIRSHAATWYNFRVNQGWSRDPAGDSAMAANLAAEALSLDHNDAIALSIQGQVLSFTRRDYDRARKFLDRAIDVCPSCHLAWTLSSATCGWVGDGPSAVAHARRAIALSPFDPFAFFAEHMLSQGHYVSGEYEDAILWGQRSAERNGRLASNLRTLAAAYVAAGEVREGRRVAESVLKLDPAFSVERFKARTPFHAAFRDEHAERLLAAGLPR